MPTTTDEQLRDIFLAGFEAGVKEGIDEACYCFAAERAPKYDPKMLGDAAIQAYEEWAKQQDERGDA